MLPYCVKPPDAAHMAHFTPAKEVDMVFIQNPCLRILTWRLAGRLQVGLQGRIRFRSEGDRAGG